MNRGGELPRRTGERLRALSRLRDARETGDGPHRPARCGYLPLELRALPPGVSERPGVAGPVWSRRSHLPLSSRHGRWRLDDALRSAHTAIGLLRDASVAANEEIDLGRVVLFDTETTSLAGGAGVHLFMIGLAWIDGEEVVIDQLLLRDPAEEQAMLAETRAHLSGAGAIFTFAGKSFDRPRLRDRMVMCGLQVGFPDSRHLDLLHVSRALWRETLGNTRLSTLEEGLLGVARVDDLSGAECPIAYFDYLSGRPARLVRALEHNFLDLLSLITLAGEISRALHCPATELERRSAARFLMRRGWRDEARRLLEGEDREVSEAVV